MTIILKEPISMAKFGVVFPANVEIKTIVYSHVRFMQHPTKEGVLGSMPKNKFTVVENN